MNTICNIARFVAGLLFLLIPLGMIFAAGFKSGHFFTIWIGGAVVVSIIGSLVEYLDDRYPTAQVKG